MTSTTTKAAPAPAPAPINLDALPPGGGSYTRQPDGTLVPNTQAPDLPADTATQATPE